MFANPLCCFVVPPCDVQHNPFMGSLHRYDHIHYISGKISKGVGILSKLKYMLPMSILKLIYNAIISPYISYCNIVWGGTYSSRLNSIRVLQNRANRIISVMNHYILLNFITRLIV